MTQMDKTQRARLDSTLITSNSHGTNDAQGVRGAHRSPQSTSTTSTRQRFFELFGGVMANK